MKRIYSESIKRWTKKVGIPTASIGTMVGLIFLYLSFSGAITITGFSGDQVCAGTINDSCYAYINFTANEDIFIYPMGYDPWGRNTIFQFSPGVKDWKLQRSWGKGWRDIPLNETCTGTWCGAPNSAGVAYSWVLRKDRDYKVRIVALKNNPSDTIKWAVNYKDKEYLDPTWLPSQNFAARGGLRISGLENEHINISINNSIISFSNQYINLNMEYIDFFVPMELQDKLSYLTPCDPGLMVCQGNYKDSIYNKDGLFHVLNDWTNIYSDRFYVETDYIYNKGSSYDISSATNFEEYDPFNPIVVLYSIGDVVIYDGKYYLCKQSIYNYNGIPSTLTQYWKEIVVSDSVVPTGFGNKRINQYIKINYSDKNIGIGDILNSGVIIDNDTKIEINLTSHNEHLIINWTFINKGDVVGSFQRVFTGDHPELLSVDYQIDKYDKDGKYIDRALMFYDNLYGEEKYVNVTIAYPKNKKILEFNITSNKLSNGIVSLSDYTEIENRYESIVSKANSIGKTETLVDDRLFTFKTYRVLIQEDSENVVYFTIPSDIDESNDMAIWIEGSFAGGVGVSKYNDISDGGYMEQLRNTDSNKYRLINNTIIKKEFIPGERRIITSNIKETLLDVKMENEYISTSMVTGNETLIANFNLLDYSDTTLFDSIKFYDINNNYSLISKNYTLKYELDNPIEECIEYSEYINKCNITRWKNLDSFYDIGETKRNIGLFIDLKPGEAIEWIMNTDGFDINELAIVYGVNAGFVNTTPTSSGQAGSSAFFFGSAVAMIESISPADAYRVTSIGFYTDTTPNNENIEFGIYEDNGTGYPGDILYADRTNSMGNSSGWISTDVDWDIDEDTSYFIAIQENLPFNGFYHIGGGNGSLLFSANTLPDQVSGSLSYNIYPIYAVYELRSYTPIDSCGTYSDSNVTYKLQNNISSTGTCLIITGSNVTIDGNGYFIKYGNASGNYAYGLQIYSNQAYDNMGVFNLNFIQDGTGSYNYAVRYSGENGYFENISIYLKNQSSDRGFYSGKTYSSQSISQNNNFSNINIFNSSYSTGGFYVVNGVNNSYFDCSSYSFYIEGVDEDTGDLFLHNVSYSTSTVDYINFPIYRYWYLDSGVNDSNGFLENANVSVFDSDNNSVFSELTDSNGDVSRYNALEYFQNSTSIYYQSNYLINVSKTGYNTDSTVINLTKTNNYFNYVLLSGYPSIERIYPTGNINVTQNEFFKVDLNVTCISGACGTINVSINSYKNIPDGTPSNPFRITTWEELAEINNNLSASYLLMNDLDNSTYGYNTYASKTANSGMGWDPIGGYFSGSLNGNYHVIRDLYINRTSNNLGLFNQTTLNGNIATIENIGLADVLIYGDGEIGVLIASPRSFIIRNSFTSGTVIARGKGGSSYSAAGMVIAGDGNMEISGSYSSVNITAYGKPVLGGLVEYYDNKNGTINNSYFNGTLSSDWYAGGIVNEIDYPYMYNVYSTGAIIGAATSGGLNAIDYNANYNNSGFWDTITTGQSTSGFGYAKNTEQMKNISTYNTINISGGLNESWSIAEIDNYDGEIWVINNTNDYPKLSWEYFPQRTTNIIKTQSDWNDSDSFYTNSTNPKTTSSLSSGQSETITFWVNATGNVGTTHDFFAFANITSNLLISDITSHWNVTIVSSSDDTCTYTSGDWVVDCSDNCNINSDVNIGGNNLILNGVGNFYVNANITIGGLDMGNSGEICNAVLYNGGNIFI